MLQESHLRKILANNKNEYKNVKDKIMTNFLGLTDQKCILFESATNGHIEILQNFTKKQGIAIPIEFIKIQSPLSIPASPQNISDTLISENDPDFYDEDYEEEDELYSSCDEEDPDYVDNYSTEMSVDDNLRDLSKGLLNISLSSLEASTTKESSFEDENEEQYKHIDQANIIKKNACHNHPRYYKHRFL